MCALLLAAALSGLGARQAHAAGEAVPTIGMENALANPGDTVTVDVTIAHNPGITGLTLVVTYDSALTLPKITQGSAFARHEMTLPGPGMIESGSYVSGCRVLLDRFDLTEDDVRDGQVVSLSFRVSPDAPKGTRARVSVQASGFDENLDRVSFSPASCVIAVRPMEPEDIADATVTVAEGDYGYTGRAFEPAVTVTLGGYELAPTTDYTVAYSKNTQAGEATVTVTGVGFYKGTATGHFTIAKAKPELSAPTARELVYDGTAQALVVAGTTSGGSLRYRVGTGGAWSASVPAAEGAGDYEVWYKVEGGTNYEGTEPQSVPVTIARRKLAVTARDQSISFGEAIATGPTQAVAAGLADGHVLTAVTLTPSTAAVGTGTITPSAAHVGGAGLSDVTANYDISYADGRLTVAKAAPSVTAPRAVAGLAYTGSPQALVTAGAAEGGTLQYRLGADGAWGADVPSATGAGAYEVWWRVRGDASHLDTEVAGPIRVTVAKAANPAVVTTAATVMRGGNRVDLAGNVTGAVGAVSFAAADAQGGSVTAAGLFTSGPAAGSVAVTVRIAGDDNHEGRTETIEVSVTEKGTAELAVEQEGTTFGEALPAPSYALPAGAGAATLSYAGTLRRGGVYEASDRPPTEAGEYSVSVSCETSDTVHTGTADFTIAPASIEGATVTLGEALTYTGERQEQRVASVTLAGDDITAWCVVSDNAGTDAGEYALGVTAREASNYAGTARKAFTIARADPHVGTVTAGEVTDSLDAAAVRLTRSDETVAGTLALVEKRLSLGTHGYRWAFTPADAKNYLGAEGTVEVTARASISPGVSMAGYTWGTTPSEPVVTGNDGDGVVRLRYFADADGRAGASPWQGVGPTTLDAGTYRIYAEVAETATHLAATTEAVSFVVAKAAPSVTAPAAAAGLVYDGEPHALATAGAAEGGALQYRLGAGGEWSAGVPAATGAGAYELWWRVVGDRNHTDVAATGPVAVRVAKAENPAHVPARLSVARGGNRVDLAGSVSDAVGEARWEIVGGALGCELTEAGVLASGDEVGTVRVRVTYAESDNHLSKSAEIEVQVLDKARAELDVEQGGMTFGGTLAAPAYKRPPASGTEALSYSGTLRRGGAYGPTDKAPAEAGSYRVAVTFETAETVYEGFADFTIEPASIAGATVTLAGALSYTGEPQRQGVGRVELAGDDITAWCSVSGDTQTGAGSYTLTVTAREASNYVGSVTKDFTIARATPEVTAPAPLSPGYDGAPHALVSAGTTSGGTLSYATAEDGAWGVEPPVATSAGDYAVWWRVDGGDNYADVAPARVDVTVARRPLTVTARAQAVTYGEGTLGGIDAAEARGLAAGHALASVTVTPSTTDAGTGTLTPSAATVADAAGADVTANYRISYADGALEIAKAVPSVTAPAAAAGLVYDGEPHALATAGAAEGGALQYRLGAGGEWSAGVPAATGAGAYELWWRVVGDRNHTDVAATGPVAVRVAKAENPARVRQAATVVRGGRVSLAENVTGAVGEVSFALDDPQGGCAVGADGTFVAAADFVGRVTVSVTVAESQNYRGLASEITVEVRDKAAGELAVRQAGATYGEKLPRPSYDAPAGGVETLSYAGTTRSGAPYAATGRAPAEAGSYSVTVTYETADTIYRGEAAFAIDPADIAGATLEGALADQTWTGSALEPRPALSFGGVALVEGADYELAWQDNVTAPGTGTVTVGGRGNFDGTRKVPFTIRPVLVGSVAVGLHEGSEQPLAAPGATLKVDAEVTAEGGAPRATDERLVWESSDESVATVDGAGVVTAVGSGSATITATARDGSGRSAGVTVAVEIPQVAVLQPVAADGYTRTGTIVATGGDGAALPERDVPGGTVVRVEATPRPRHRFRAWRAYAQRDGRDVTGELRIGREPPSAAGGLRVAADPEAQDAPGTETGYFVAPDYAVTVTAQFLSLDEPIDLSACAARLSAESFAYDASRQVPEVTLVGPGGLGTLEEGVEYEVEFPEDSTSAGPKRLTLTAVEGSGFTGTLACDYRIEPRGVAGATISAIASQRYTGSAIEPAPAVAVDGRALVRGVDYTLSWASNVNPGTASVTVTGTGNYGGTARRTFAITAPRVAYRTHVQNVGWQGWARDGKTAGTSGRGLRLEGIELKVEGAALSGSVEYRTHIQNVGWQAWRRDGKMSGTSGRGLRLEAIQIRLTNEMAKRFDVYYRVHAQNVGWMGWARNGAMAGTAGYSYRLEAIQVRLVLKGGRAPGSTSAAYRDRSGAVSGVPDFESSVLYRTHVQNVGWQSWARDGGLSGTSGRALRLEAINLKLGGALSGGVRYRTHIQNVGWQAWKKNGELSGTSGRGLRLEAIQIELTGAASKTHSVWYRVHAQNVGWMGWARDGQQAGTAGYGYRLEAIEVVVRPASAGAPGPTAGAFRRR